MLRPFIDAPLMAASVRSSAARQHVRTDWRQPLTAKAKEILMQAITSRPQSESSPIDPAVAVNPTPDSVSHADVALVVAILGPLALIGLLALVGLGIAPAVCITFALVFAVTTTTDIRWLLQRRRSTKDLRTSQL
jgi:hypothetical protein